MKAVITKALLTFYMYVFMLEQAGLWLFEDTKYA